MRGVFSCRWPHRSCDSVIHDGDVIDHVFHRGNSVTSYIFDFFLEAPGRSIPTVDGDFSRAYFQSEAWAPGSSRVWFLTLANLNIKENSKIIMCVFEIAHSRYSAAQSWAKNMTFLYLTRELLHGFPWNLKQSWISGTRIVVQSLGGKTRAVVEISPITVFSGGPDLERKHLSWYFSGTAA